MARDLKVVQHGVNVQANDLAVPPGTPLRAVNIDYHRDGVAMRRGGFDRFDAGLPWLPIDIARPLLANGPADALTTRGIFELFSRDRPMMVSGGLILQYEESTSSWYSVPVNLPHKWIFFGDADLSANSVGLQASGLGRAVISNLRGAGAYSGSITSPLVWQDNSYTQFMVGTICNDTNQAAIATASTAARFYQPADVAGTYISDQTTIRFALDGSILAGSLTATGSTNGTGAAATFDGAQWMVSVGSDLYVADNSNQIRKVTSAGVVTTAAGSVTAGNVDGVGTAARFNFISGMAYDGSQFIYVAENFGFRVRKFDIVSGSVTIFAGALTPTSGFVNATGTAARFGNLSGCEIIGSTLYVGDNLNNAIRAITLPGAVVTTYAGGNAVSAAGMVGGAALSSSLPSPVLRGKYTPVYNDLTKSYLIIECAVASTSIDVGLLYASDNSPTAARSLFHIARCPLSRPSYASGGPNKLDTIGPNAYALADVRGVDAGDGVLFTTSERPRSIDLWTRNQATDVQPRLRSTGIFPPEAPSVTVTTGTTFSASMTVAYRTVSGLTLPNGKIVLGPPSERIVLIGSLTAAWAASVTMYPPPGLPYDGMPFAQIYRTRQASAAVDPGDQMFLCYEAALPYGAALSIIDQLPDGLLGSELVTNLTEGGFAASPLPPPNFATDIASFDRQAALSNYIENASVRIKVVGVTSLVAATSTITLTPSTNRTYLASALKLLAIAGATDPAANSFQIGSGGTAAQNAVQTARNIVACINRSPDAYLMTAAYDESDPGTFVVTNLYPGRSATPLSVAENSAGVVAVSTVQSFVTFATGDVGAAASFRAISTNNSIRQINAVVYSEQDAFDSFPGGNSYTVGPATEGIVRLLPISDTLLTVKDDSVWRNDASFVPTIYDKALSCSLPNSFAMVNNQWIGAFSRGFVALAASQGIALGRPIDRDVTAQYSSFVGSLTADFASAAGIDTTGNYLCTLNRRTYCFNTTAQAWSEWQMNALVYQHDPSFDTAISGKHSGMLGLSAFRDSFISSADDVRSVYRQRDYRRDAVLAPTTSRWYKNFADASYVFSGSLSASGLTITVANYVATSNPGSIPPYAWVPPQGEVANTTALGATFAWVLEVTQSGVTKTAQGIVTPTTIGSATSPVTISLANAMTQFDAGASVEVVAYSPIICRVQYAPFASPGSGNMFGDVLMTMERCQPGWLIGRFFSGKRDCGDGNAVAPGYYSDIFGITRALMMASITTASAAPLTNGLTRKMNFEDVQRFTTPAERANWQTLGFEWWEGNAWQPLAVKAVTVDKRPTENAKVTQ